jgi:hypothetical protein
MRASATLATSRYYSIACGPGRKPVLSQMKATTSSDLRVTGAPPFELIPEIA